MMDGYELVEWLHMAKARQVKRTRMPCIDALGNLLHSKRN